MSVCQSVCNILYQMSYFVTVLSQKSRYVFNTFKKNSELKLFVLQILFESESNLILHSQNNESTIYINVKRPKRFSEFKFIKFLAASLKFIENLNILSFEHLKDLNRVWKLYIAQLYWQNRANNTNKHRLNDMSIIEIHQPKLCKNTSSTHNTQLTKKVKLIWKLI